MAAAQPRTGVVGLLQEIARVLGLYIRGQALITIIVTLLYEIGFGVVKLPLWPIVALVCGGLNVIPRIGSLIALAIAAGVTFIGRGDIWRVLEVLAVWVLIQTIEGYVLTPRILGQRLGLRPLAVFIAILLGGALFGVLGVMLAVPCLAVAVVIWKFFRRHRKKLA